jgi:hypothetical protein
MSSSTEEVVAAFQANGGRVDSAGFGTPVLAPIVYMSTTFRTWRRAASSTAPYRCVST